MTLVRQREVLGRLCGERNVIRNRPDAEDLLGSTRIAFIRDPIDRFLSGFVNKCILKGPYEFVEYCFGCKSDLNCFVEAFRKELWTIYETKGHHQSAIGYHLAPLTWHCNFKEHLRDYIFLRRANGTAGIQNTAKELYRVLESVAVPKSQREDIKNAVLGRCLCGRMKTIIAIRRRLFKSLPLAR
ncbi:hypothetical protein COOONC_16975 [Cooperia oncophora]